MRDSFTEWLKQTPFVQEPDEATSFVEICDAVLGLIGEHRPQFIPTAWVPDDAHELWTIVDETRADPDFDGDDVGGEVIADAMELAAFALLMYLGDTGQWAGTEDDLQHCLNDLEPVEDSGGPQPYTRSTVVPAVVEPAVEQVALASLPIVERLTRFVDWFGPGKPVTGTGVLRPVDATALAGILGIALPPGKLRTMLDVVELCHLWSVAKQLDLVAVSSTRAYPGSALLGWRSSDLDLLRRAVTEYVAFELTDNDWKYPLHTQVDILAVQFVLAGMTDRPLAAFNGHPPGAPPETALLYALLEGTLENLADEGLIVIDAAVTVPEALQTAVLAGLPDYNLDDDEPLFDDADYDLPPIDGVAEQEVALKIELEGCEPAVWRRVIVASTDSLADLHRIIQAVFGWDDDHMHEFIDGEPYSGAPVYVPAQSIAGRDLPGPANPEESTLVGQVLSEPRQTLTYLYDFGDDWIHKITVDAVNGPLQQVPRCTAGNGMAPFEDCGGPYGWAMLVEAINDPDNPQHEDMREWTGLGKGIKIDPAAFDVVQADAALRRIRNAAVRM